MGRVACLLLTALSLATVAGDQHEERQERLKFFQPLVGDWRGVGQPQRGSTRDSWVEEAAWSWSFDATGPALVAKLPKARYFPSLRLLTGESDRSFVLLATPADGGEAIRYTGQLGEQNQLVLRAETSLPNYPTRLTFRFAAAGDRLLLLMEKPGPSADSFTRLAEVGYTRQGSGFGKTANQRECVVTGGLGTIEVTHAGKTYYVCCTGCRDYFNTNAEKVLAEYAARQAKK